MWVALISFLYTAKISLQRTWCFGTISSYSILLNALQWEKIIPPSVLFFIGLIQLEFLSILCRIIWYKFSWIDLGRNFPVWSVWDISLGLYIVKKKPHWFSSIRNLATLLSYVCFWERTLVDLTPCHWLCMWLFWVSSDSEKCLLTFFIVISGHFR